MKILKLSDTAMSDVENLYILLAFARQASPKGKIIFSVSAKSDTSDLLMEAAKLASVQNELYKGKLKKVEQESLQLVRELIPLTEQSAVLSRIKKMCNELEDLCEGVFLVSDLSLKVKDRVISYGDLLSSYTLSAKLRSLEIPHQYMDSHDLIRSNSDLGLAGINFPETGNAIRNAINNPVQQLFVLPDITIAHHKFSSIVSRSFGIEPVEIALESDKSFQL